MCRRNRIPGSCLISFGIGLILGRWIESTFFCILTGIAALAIGWCILQQK